MRELGERILVRNLYERFMGGGEAEEGFEIRAQFCLRGNHD